METFVLRRGLADPRAVVAFDQRVLHGADIQQNARGLRGDDAGADSSLGVDLRILLVRLIE